MKFLIDNNISSKLLSELNKVNFQAEHVYEIGMSRSSDNEIFKYAKKHDMIIISADTDFGYILSKWNSSKPSLILFRHISLKPKILTDYLKAIVETYKEDLNKGCIVVVEKEKVRIRSLPMYQ